MSIELILAIRNGDTGQVGRLLDEGADLHWRLPAEGDHGAFLDQTTPLMVAAAAPESNAEIVALLLERGADPFDVSAGEVTAAWYASGGGSGCPLNEKNRKELEPGHVYWSWGGGDVERLRLILDRTNDPNESADNGRSCVYEACSVGDPHRLKLLIERGGNVGPALPSRRYDAPSHLTQVLEGVSLGRFQLIPLIAAAESGSLECVKLIVEAGFPADSGLDGTSALSSAGSEEVAEYLWNLGVRPNPGAFGFDALDDAIEEDNLPVLRFFAGKAGREVIQGKLLTASGVRMNPRAVRLLLELGADANKPDRHYGSPLHYACWQGDGNSGRADSVVEETVQALIDGGADPNQKANGGYALHEAAAGDWGSATSARVLLRNGAQVDPLNDQGVTPLMLAAELGEAEVVRELLKHGADRALRDKQGRTALDHAKDNLKVWKGPMQKFVGRGLDKLLGRIGLEMGDVSRRARIQAEEVVNLLGENP